MESTITTRVCSKCKAEKSLEEYHKNKADKVHGRQWSCKPCNIAASKERYDRDPKYMVAKHRELRYGVSQEVYDQMLADQNSVCAICKQTETTTHVRGGIRGLSVDHCHTTGTVRGLLCQKCNTALGMFNDSEETLMNAINYLRKV